MRYVIIGNGAAGNAAAAAIRKQDPGGEVLIFSDEPAPAYYRPLIVNLIEDIHKDIFVPQELNMKAATGQTVMALDAGAKRLTFLDGATCTYDRLLLATGASAIIPDLPGLQGHGTFVLRTLADAETLAQAAGEAKEALVIGAGRVGLKAAMALRQRNLSVTIVEQGPGPAPMQFDQEAGGILSEALAAQGFNLLFGQTVAEVQRAGDRLIGAILADGRKLPAQVIVAAVGVRPKVELAQAAGLTVKQGIVVDRHLRTSAPEIYAAGDVAETTDLVTGHSLVSGLWTNAVEMGRIAGRNMAGGHQEYQGAWGVLNALEVAGIPTVAVGLTTPPLDAGYQVLRRRRGNNYRKLVCKDGILVGALLLGALDGAGVYAGLIRSRTRINDLAAALDQPRRGLASRLAAIINQRQLNM
ncbi:MAG: FAD-dependent oxidoreductase [Deltaproteobacteria bacterium]|nr:FAD-dependent oxidoreductase [Deltaproteobacteria bacterium]